MIRVIIERRIKPGQEQEFAEVTAQLRAGAVPRRGYVSGETWVDSNDPTRSIVISTWLSQADWDAWANSAERKAIAEAIEPLLSEPSRTYVLRPPQGVEVRSDVAMPAA